MAFERASGVQVVVRMTIEIEGSERGIAEMGERM